MSYLVLARKYRPRSFEQLVGQEHVVQALSNALVSQRLHHAYLFTGTRGVGKTTVSRILAKSLNCNGADGQGDITPTPCGVCDACRDIDAGRHVDYIELDAASNRGVDEISQLLDQAVYKPVVGRFKVYMIDEVHMLSNTAFNAMLKTLEEPPDYLKFVLATTDPQKVPPTVLSRCLQFNLRPMAPATVQQHLQHVLADEGIEAEPAALRLLARAARGSMRDALSLTDQAIAYGAGRLQGEAVRRMLGAVDRSQAERVLRALAARDGAALVATVDELRGLGLSAAGLLEELASTLQSMAVVRAVPQALPDDDPDAPAVASLAPHFGADEMQLHYSMALHGRAELGLAPDEYSGLVMVLLRMLAFRPAEAGVGEAAGGGGAAARRTPPAPADPDAPAPPVRATAALAVPPPPRVTASVPSPSARPAPVHVAALPPEPAQPDGPAPVARPAEAVADRALATGDRSSDSGSEAPSAPVAPVVPAEARSPLGDRWCETVAGLLARGAVSGMARELAMQAELRAIEPGEGGSLWRLRVERESLRAPAQRDKLQAALQSLLNETLRLELEAGTATDSVALREAAARARRQAEAEQTIHEDPLVRELLTQFKSARIVPGSIKPTEQRT